MPSSPLNVRLALDHDRLPRARDRMREPERKRDHPARLVRAQRRPHNIRLRAQQKHDLARGRLLRERLSCDLLWRR